MPLVTAHVLVPVPPVAVNWKLYAGLWQSEPAGGAPLVITGPDPATVIRTTIDVACLIAPHVLSTAFNVISYVPAANAGET